MSTTTKVQSFDLDYDVNQILIRMGRRLGNISRVQVLRMIANTATKQFQVKSVKAKGDENLTFKMGEIDF